MIFLIFLEEVTEFHTSCWGLSRLDPETWMSQPLTLSYSQSQHGLDIGRTCKQQMLHPTASGNDASENVAKHMHKMHSAAFSHQPTLINITQSYAKVYATLLAWPIAMRRSAKGRKVLLARSGQSAALKMSVWGREKKRSALGTFFDAITSTPLSVTPISGLL